MSKKMRDGELGQSNRNRPREPKYKADDEDSDARLHPNQKRLKRYIIVSDEKKKEPGEPKDNQEWDPDYNPFFDGPLFQDPRKTYKKAIQDPMVKRRKALDPTLRRSCLKT